MKKILIYLLIFTSFFYFSACEEASEILDNASNNPDETSDALKEALKISTDTSVNSAHALDGYFKNQSIKIMFPEDAKIIETTLNKIGASSLVDEVILKINRAAEDAAIEAKPIFVEAIKNITFTDAAQILAGQDSAATNYLRTNTDKKLYTLFKPKIENSIEKIGAQTAWQTVVTKYNKIPLVTPVTTDLASYTTHNALDGLFYLIKEEESKIRNDINHRVTDLLRRIFE